MKRKDAGLSARQQSVAAALSAQQTAATPATPESEVFVITSVRLPKSIHRQLRQIAFDDESSIHALIMEGVHSVLAKRGTNH